MKSISVKPVLGVAVLAALTVAASSPAAAATSQSDASRTPAMADNPFQHPSPLPYQLPPFDKIKDSEYRPAFEAGMREELEEVAAISNNREAPSFDNTIVALERSGRLLTRVDTVFSSLNQCNTNDEMQKIDTEMSTKLSAHEDAISLDSALFARVDALYERRASLKLDPESSQLLERYHTQFVRAGAGLSDSAKAQLRKLNEQIAALTTRFKQNVLKATKEQAIVVDSADELKGLSTEQIGAAASAAAARGLTGKWVLPLQNTTSQPVLERLRNRALRERVYRASIDRGTGGASDNTVVIAQLVKLRAERAKLLGYPNHAAYRLADEAAENPANVSKMLGQVAPAALARAKVDAADLQKLIDAESAANHTEKFALQAWDWPYYAEQLRKQRYDFDQAQVAPYFELDRVLTDGVFYAAHELYGLTFKERTDLPVYQTDVRVFEVFDRDGKPLALFLGDYYARDNKGGGAWMNSYVKQSKLFDLKPVVANHLNIPKPAAGQPTLLTFDEVRTLFHEFGHAIHGMLSNVHYPLLSGTSVPRDFVEYPSQYNEMWAHEPKVLAHYARHYKTGAPMPQDLLNKVLAAQKFDQGYATTEYLAAALLDQAWHTIDVAQAPAAKDVASFEANALKKAGIDYAPVPTRYHSAYFSHIFSGGYSGSYYAYLWSEVLARDTGAWLHAHGGLTRANGDRLRAKVLSRGRTEDPEKLFEDFYGRGPDIGPLLEYRGLTEAKP
ncbi:MAG: M3 family metallopeptidase [Gammaproteobacteria bacterium]